ncbi:MAG: Asp-tRNA(Asn)/Glu-tRNA(Gln) amidotransferase subunit GatB [Minisyncoccales bacterium]|jgi:aspartyl-tRNA(Asn)/glutamyl-tRNA(Gln) amidotransferase subunit B
MREVVIGLEIHVALNTRSKMFCRCLNDSDSDEPNKNICPICTGQPGALPVANKAAIEKTIKTGMALNCFIPEHSRFDRKNYFYPDLPKGYQISQQDHPLCSAGYIDLDGKRIRINRIHLEEDAGKLIHQEEGNYSLVDFNRSGTALMEIVTEPDIRSPLEARKFVEELREILRYLKVSNVDMEKGEMRIDANISISSALGKMDGGRVEIKNLNSFRSIEKALHFEVDRQSKILNQGEIISQQTRGWDDNKEETIFQRSKEGSADYRYFPDPDLSPIDLTDSLFINVDEIRSSIPELPKEKRERFGFEYGLSEKEIDFLVKEVVLGDYYEKTISELFNWFKEEKIKKSIEDEDKRKLSRLAANWLLTDLRALLKNDGDYQIPITPENFAELILMISEEKVSTSIAKTVLKEMFATGGDPSDIIEDKGLTTIEDDIEVEAIVDLVLSDNPKAIEDYKKGKEASIKFLIGQTMAKAGGRVDPKIAERIIKKKISY